MNDDFKPIDVVSEKNNLINEININGDKYLNEINNRNPLREKKKLKLIKYLLKKSDEHSLDELKSFDLYTLTIMCETHKEKKRNLIYKIYSLFIS